MILNEIQESSIQSHESIEFDQNSQKFNKLSLRKVGGFDLLFNRPFITKGNKCLFIISGHNIRKYLVENGNFLDEYYFGSDKFIISIQQNENDDEVLVVFEDGQVIQWNYVENFKISDSYIKIDYPDSKISYFKKIENVYYFVTQRYKKKQPGHYLYYCFKDQPDNIIMMDKNNFKQFSPKSIAFGPHEKIELCAVIYKHQLHIYQLPIKNNSKNRTHFINPDKHFTTVAFHPLEKIVATGDVVGQIFIWNDILSTKPIKSIMHWHSQSVADLAFAPSGNCLYSVGAEMVLVKWNLVGQHFGEKDFVPRIGAKIKYVTVDSENKFVITSHLDQCLQIIDTQLNGIRTVVEGLSHHKFSSGLHFNPRLNALVLNGRVGHIQFYCPSRQKQLFQFDVVQQNVINIPKIGSKNILKALKKKEDINANTFYPIEVTKIAISEDGFWLATVEYRNDYETSLEIRLKFWLLKRENNGFSLNTTVHLPHQEEINFIQFSPQKDDKTFHLVTTSIDKTFKIWDLKSNDDNKWWNCSRNGSLNNHSIPRMASFSSDASLISVLFGNIITLWELDSPTSIRYIPRMDIFKFSKTKTVIFISFGFEKFSHYLIEGRHDSVVVHNVIKKFETVFTYEHRSKFQINSISINQYENLLALVSIECINFLSLKLQKVIAHVDLCAIKNFHGAITSSIFNLKFMESSKQYVVPMFKKAFFCITDKNELFQAVPSTNDDEESYVNESNVIFVGSHKDKKTELFIKHVDDRTGPLSLLISHKSGSSTNNNKQQPMIDCEKVAKSLVDKFFYDVPTHVFPPVNIIEKSFLTSYLECINLSSKSEDLHYQNNHKTKSIEDQNVKVGKRFHSPDMMDIDEKLDVNDENVFLESIFKLSSKGCNQDQIVNENEFYWLDKYLNSVFDH